MRIDAHQHFWDYDPVTFDWIGDEMANIRKSFSPQDLEPILKRNNFDGCVFIQVNQTEEETTHYHHIATEHDFIKGIVGWTDLLSDQLEERLEEYSSLKKLKGFRHIVQGEPLGFMKNPKFIEGIKKLNKFDYTYDILIFSKQMIDAVSLLKACPDNRFILDHIAKPNIKAGEINRWANFITRLAEFPNLYCKVSGMVTEADFKTWKKEDFYIYLDTVLNHFGIDRLVYGSDWPVCLAAAEYEEQLDIVESYFRQLSQTEKDKIFGLNAQKFYNISE